MRTRLRGHGLVGRPHLLLGRGDLLALALAALELALLHVAVLHVEVALQSGHASLRLHLPLVAFFHPLLDIVRLELMGILRSELLDCQRSFEQAILELLVEFVLHE